MSALCPHRREGPRRSVPPPPHSSLQPHRTAEWNGVAGAPGAVPPLPGAAGPAEGARAVLTHGPPRCRRGRSPRAGALRAGGALPSGGTGRCGEGHRVRRLCRSPSALSAPRHSASRLRVGALDVGVGGGASPGAPRSPFGAVRPIGAARCRRPPPRAGPFVVRPRIMNGRAERREGARGAEGAWPNAAWAEESGRPRPHLATWGTGSCLLLAQTRGCRRAARARIGREGRRRRSE